MIGLAAGVRGSALHGVEAQHWLARLGIAALREVARISLEAVKGAIEEVRVERKYEVRLGKAVLRFNDLPKGLLGAEFHRIAIDRLPHVPASVGQSLEQSLNLVGQGG